MAGLFGFYLVLNAITWRGIDPGLNDLVFVAVAPAAVWGGTYVATRYPRRSGGTWWILHDPSRGSAVAATNPPDEAGRVKVASAGAHPRRRGLGVELFTAILAHHYKQAEIVHGYAFHSTAKRLYRGQLGLKITPIRWTGGLYYCVTSAAR